MRYSFLGALLFLFLEANGTRAMLQALAVANKSEATHLAPEGFHAAFILPGKD